MSKPTSDNTEKLFYKFVDWYDYKNKISLLEIDFKKPWWNILWKQRFLVAINIFNQAFSSIFLSVLPVAVGFAIQMQNVWYFLYCVFAMVGARTLTHYLYYFDPLLRLQTSQSITYNASRYFLTTDPINHTNRSSGQIIAKTNRGSSSMESLISLMSFDFISLFFVLISSVTIFWSFNYLYGLVVLFSLIIILIFNVYAILFKKKFDKLIIKYDDQAQAINVETLQQVSYVRSSFASNEQIAKLKQKNFVNLYTDATSWRISGYIITITQLLFFTSFGIVGYLLLSDKSISAVVATSLLISYFGTGSRFYYVGHDVKQLIKSYVGVVDMFEFINKYGEQTYPVLENDLQIKNKIEK